jgi:stage II sporulation protein D
MGGHLREVALRVSFLSARLGLPLLSAALAGLVCFVVLPASLGAAETIRVGVFSLFKPQELLIRPAAGEAIEFRAGSQALTLEGSEYAVVRLREGALECVAKGQAVRAPEVRATGRGSANRVVLAVPGKIERQFSGEVSVRAAPGVLLAVVVMDLETAVASAVAAEAPPGAPPEALKAQAVAARSFYLAHSGARHAGFDYCDTTHCQFLREPPPADHPACLAAAATRGLVITFDGRPVEALFSASCGGRTHSLRELGMQPAAYPFFPVECPWCQAHAERWRTRIDAETAAALAGPKSERRRIDLARALGWRAVPGNDYEVVAENGEFFLAGKGAGHGIGLCQRGAAGMAQAGASFLQILAHYYPNTVLVASPR